MKNKINRKGLTLSKSTVWDLGTDLNPEELKTARGGSDTTQTKTTDIIIFC